MSVPDMTAVTCVFLPVYGGGMGQSRTEIEG